MSESSAATGVGGTAVIVLGMHRSGTSCLTGSLQQCGLHLGDVQEWNPYNRKGNRESKRIMALNDAVLEYSGGRWDAPPASLRWGPDLVAERASIIKDLRDGAARHWGFKDPRTVLTLPFWLEAIDDVRLVGTWRQPMQVARSLNARGGMPYEQALDLWCQYNTRLLDYRQRFAFPLLSFDLPDDDYRRAVEHAAQLLGLDAEGDSNRPGFFDDGLRTAGEKIEAPALPQAADDLLRRLQRESLHADA